MDVGRTKLAIGSTYTGNPDAALDAVFLAIGQIKDDLIVSPGLAFITASVAVTKGMAVNINTKQVRPADASLSRAAIGICVKAAGIGQKAGIMLGMGFVSGLSGLTVNSSVYLGNAGALVYILPGAGMLQGLGWTLSATEMFVTISQPSR